MREQYQLELYAEHVPPNLGRLFGYQRSNRWVAFFWGEKIGRTTQGYGFDGEAFNPINPLAWDTFFNHPLMVALNHRRIEGHAVQKFRFGDGFDSSHHWLMLDRLDRCLFAALKTRALDQLRTNGASSVDRLTKGMPHPALDEMHDEAIPPHPSGGLEMLMEMTAWLDDRIALMKKKGQWPIIE